MKKIITKNNQETFELGKEIAAGLQGGDVLGLIGELGAGKTALTQGIASGLGVKQILNSPTFVIMKTYPLPKGAGAKILAHVDTYRLNSYQELEAIGLGEYLADKEAITIIEWADKIKKELPSKTKIIKATHGKKENERIFDLKF